MTWLRTRYERPLRPWLSLRYVTRGYRAVYVCCGIPKVRPYIDGAMKVQGGVRS